jgi:two-component system, cell cycle response regulator
MTARVLVVDDMLANVKLLEARLNAEYFEVLTARSGEEALAVVAASPVDVVLLDVMMPGMDGFEVCRQVKSASATAQLPIIMVTALDQAADKVRGLEAGVDDFLTKPVDDIALITRVKNLARLKALSDEMMGRMATSADFKQLQSGEIAGLTEKGAGRILLVEDQPRVASRVLSWLQALNDIDVEPDLQAAMLRLAEQPYDLLIVSLSLGNADGLRLCGQVRSLERTRHLPIIVLVESSEEARLLRALAMGVNDYLTRPIDKSELAARVRTQIKRKRHCDYLRDRLEESVELAVTDALTGLNNRRYMEAHLKALEGAALSAGQPLSVLLVDVDNFKAINDSYGHAAGDTILRELAARFRRNTRAIDTACRLGGEEFVILMPTTGLADACQIGERVRQSIAAELFHINRDSKISVTASVGIASLEGPHDTFEQLLARADGALYAAKKKGRNRVVADAA